MATVIARVKWTDYDEVLRIFAEHADVRKSFGCQGTTIFRNAEDPNEVMILFEWDELESMDRFFADPDVQSIALPTMANTPINFVVSESHDFSS